MKSPVIFSDLDGTLLDHHDYSFSAALPGLKHINHLHIPLILNSSKTYSEIVNIRSEMQNEHPFVVENGAAIYIPQDYFPGFDQPLNQHILGADYEQILGVIHNIRDEQGFQFKGFADYSVEELSIESGLSISASEHARQRAGSEPIKWQDNQHRLKDFKAAIEKHNLRLIKGGRFVHVMGQNDKAKAMLWLKEKYRKKQAQQVLLIALGDSENDRKMLDNADIAAVIRSSKGSCLQLTRPEKEVIYTKSPAPEGWQEAMNIILKRIDKEG